MFKYLSRPTEWETNTNYEFQIWGFERFLSVAAWFTDSCTSSVSCGSHRMFPHPAASDYHLIICVAVADMVCDMNVCDRWAFSVFTRNKIEGNKNYPLYLRFFCHQNQFCWFCSTRCSHSWWPYTWFSTPGSLHLVQYTWFSTPGSVHLVHFIWFCTPGSVHLVHFIWFCTPGSVHLVQYTWFTTTSSVHLVHFTWFLTPDSVNLVHYTWFSTPDSVHLLQYTWFSTPGSLQLVQYIWFSTPGSVHLHGSRNMKLSRRISTELHHHWYHIWAWRKWLLSSSKCNRTS